METPLGGSWDVLQRNHEERIKTFLCGSEGKELKISIYLNNEEGTIGVEEGDSGKKNQMKKGKILLEIWTLKFQ